jgi:hypothetical protein
VSATTIIALSIGLAVAPAAPADPSDPSGTVDAESQEIQPVAPPITASPPGSGDTTPEAAAACSQFAAGLDVAASWYSDFANNIAGDAPPNYADPIVNDSNVMGRTALREAAANALNASSTPGLQPDIADPMRAWSMDASKLLILMGLRTPVDVINGAANDLNDNTTSVQMACAAAGTHA